MDNNKITDIINYDIPKFNVDIKYEYAYYDEILEDQNPVNHIDINLKDTNINLNMYNEIRIDISEFKNRYRFDSNFSFLNVIDPKIIEKIKSYQKKNLYVSFDNSTQTSLITYFNNSADINFDDKFISIVSNQNEKDRNNIMSAFNITSQSTGINTDFATQKFFRNYNVSKNYLYDFIIGKTNNLYNSEMKNIDFFSNYSNEKNQKLTSNYSSKVFNIDKSLSASQQNQSNNNSNEILNETVNLNEQTLNESDYDQTVIFEKLNHFYIVPPYEDEIKMRNETGVAFLGFIIKKNTIVNQTNYKAGAQFVYIDINSLNSTNEIVLFDDMIRYSSSYTYEISPLFLLSLYKHNGVAEIQNIPLITFNLLYTHSYRSNKIFSYDYFSPEPPNGFHVNTRRKKVTSIELKWSHPTNPQQDVIGFQIYRRRLLTEPFKLIKVILMKEINEFGYFNPSDSYEGFNNLFYISPLKKMTNNMYEFIDDSVDFIKDTYIYAICSIDAHGMISNYSNQIGVRYSTIYNTLLVDHVSDQNAPRTYPNLYVKRKTQFFKNDDILFDFTPNFLNKQELSIYFTPDLFDLKKSTNDQNPSVVFNPQKNQYQLNLTRLTDLENKSVFFTFI